MDEAAQRFNAELAARGINWGHTRIGVHTGVALVGNIGTHGKLKYGALGDTLNTASRVEGLNKYIGSRVAVTGETAAQCRHQAAFLAIEVFPAIVLADKLVLISPHWEGIRYEFERAFKARYQSETKRSVELEWLNVGGSSETLRYIESEFKNKPAGIGIDIFFGGGFDPYVALKQAHLLESYTLPQSLLENIPPKLAGVPLFDPGSHLVWRHLGGLWHRRQQGRARQLTKLPVVNAWEDLASPQRVRLGRAPPTLVRAAACTRFTKLFCRRTAGRRVGRSSPPWGPMRAVSPMRRVKLLKTWPSAKSPTVWRIDFYAWAQVKEAGADKIGFVMPDNLTIITP